METLGQFGLLVALVVIGSVVLAVCLSSKSISRALIPEAVADAVLKLLPRGLIADAESRSVGEFQVQAKVSGKTHTVYVRRFNGATIGWTYDPTVKCPRSGTYAFTGLKHDLQPDSAISPEIVERNISTALSDVLKSKGFDCVETKKAQLLVRVFGAIEEEVTLQTVGEVFDEPNGYEWASALRSALQHEKVGDVATFTRGSLVLEIVDGHSGSVLWRAALTADTVADVSEEERQRRMREAVVEMLKGFPPPKVKAPAG